MSSNEDSEPEVSDDQGEVEIKEENMDESDDESNDEQSDDDEGEEDADADEDDEEDLPRKKRAKSSKRGSGFIDLMANVGDDEEDEDEGEADYYQQRRDDEDEERPLERHGRKYFQEFKDRDDADIVADIEERAKRRDEYQHHTANLEQQNLLPSVRDPKLYTIPCKMGTEQETVVALMSKSVSLANEGKPLKIKSAFYNPSIRGFVYIESYKEDYVVAACQGLRNLVMFRGKKAISSQALRLVPIKEMVQVMQASKKSTILKPYSWVRLKRGRYAGDLAQVMDSDEAESRAMLKIVPRIDLQALAAKREALKNPPPPGQPRKRQRRGARPPQRLFNFNEILAAGGQVEHLADRVILFGGKRYRDGYLFEWTKLDGMNTSAVVPMIEELQLFEDKSARDPDAPGAEAAGPMAAAKNMTKRVASFCKGDVVKVLSGELKNLKGTIVSVKTDADGQQLHVKPMLAALENQELVFTPSEVCKFFQIGDHVEVLAGRHETETGFVTKVDGEFAFVFSELNKNEVKVFASDCRLCEKTATGVDTLGKYALGDMVMIGTQNVGVIVRIDKEAVTVLTNNGAAQEVKHQQLGLKRSSRNAVALDQNNNQLALGDLCKLEQGPNKGKQGTVLHLFRSFVFLQSQEEVKNGGVMVARSRHLALLGGKREQPPDMYMQPANPGSVLMSPSRSTFGMKGKGGKGGKGMGKGKGKGKYGNDALIGQKVLIKRGPNKGYQGLVKDVTLLHARIELVAKRKIVNIPIMNGQINDMIEVIGLPGNMGPGGPGTNMGAQNQFAPPMTPGHADVMRTPAHGNDPLATPGGDTDAWDPDVGRTPAHDTSANWGASEGPGTPSFSGASPWGMGGMSPHEGGGYTPGGYTPSSMDGGYGFKTDYTPGPGTPGAFNPTPGAGTPGTPGSNFTPGYGGNTPGFGQPAENDNWLVHATGVLVQIDQGEHAGKTGVIRSSEGIHAQVEVSGDMTVTIDIGQMTPVVPTKKDDVVVISDADKGGRGSLIGIDGEDGIVKMQPSLDIKILRLDSLAKLASTGH